MARKSYFDYGDNVRCRATFSDSDGVAHDPTDVYFQFWSPDATSVTAYHYGADPQLVKSDTGVYYVDLNADEVGIWRYRFYATGTGQAAAESYFNIKESAFD